MEQFPYLLEALYSMEAQYQHTLSFEQNEKFFPIPGRNKDENWLHVVNISGNHGYVPTNYVETVKCSPQLLCGFIEEVLSNMNKASDETSQEKAEVIEALMSARMSLEVGPSHPRKSHKKPAPAPPDVVQESMKHIADLQTQLSPKKNIIPPLPTPNQPMADLAAPAELPNDKTDEVIQKEETAETDEIIQLPDFSSLMKPDADVIDIKDVDSPDYCDKSVQAATVPAPDLPQDFKIADIFSLNLKTETSDGNVDVVQPDSEENGSKLAFKLVFAVRDATDLRYNLAQEAVKAVLQTLSASLLPSPYMQVLSLLKSPCDFPVTLLMTSNDASQLSTLFQNMKMHVARESQQAGHWVVDQSDVDSLEETLEKILALLSKTHSGLSRHFIVSDDYEIFRDGLQLLETQTSWPCRRLLLSYLYECMRLAEACIAQAINSFLPTELLRDLIPGIQIERLQIAARLLLAILSTGEKLPVTSLMYMGSEFVTNVIGLVENNKDESVADDLVGVLVGLNLQYDNSNNAVLDALETYAGSSELTEKLIVLLNRGSDPLIVFEHSQEKECNSVLRLLLLVFDRQKTATIFYQNDLEVVFDIVLRLLCDLAPGDKKKTCCLTLLDRMIKNTDYVSRPYRASDFKVCLYGIMSDLDELGCTDSQQELDKNLAATIIHGISGLA